MPDLIVPVDHFGLEISLTSHNKIAPVKETPGPNWPQGYRSAPVFTYGVQKGTTDETKKVYAQFRNTSNDTKTVELHAVQVESSFKHTADSGVRATHTQTNYPGLFVGTNETARESASWTVPPGASISGVEVECNIPAFHASQFDDMNAGQVERAIRLGVRQVTARGWMVKVKNLSQERFGFDVGYTYLCQIRKDDVALVRRGIAALIQDNPPISPPLEDDSHSGEIESENSDTALQKKWQEDTFESFQIFKHNLLTYLEEKDKETQKKFESMEIALKSAVTNSTDLRTETAENFERSRQYQNYLYERANNLEMKLRKRGYLSKFHAIDYVPFIKLPDKSKYGGTRTTITNKYIVS